MTGVVDRHHLEKKPRIRYWPDGRTENHHEDDPVDYPMWPHHQQSGACVTASPRGRWRSGPAGRGAGQPAACRSLAASRVGSRAIAAPFSRSASRNS